MSDGYIVLVVTTIVTLSGAWWRRARLGKQFGDAAERLWAYVERPIDFREPTADDHVVVAQLEAAGAECIDIERYFRRLGDLIPFSPGFQDSIPIRLYVSVDGTIAAYLSAPNGTLTLESYAGDEEVVTRRGGRQHHALPLYVRFETCEASTSIVDMVAKHRARLPSDKTLLKLDSLAAVRDQFKGSHARMRAWRITCDPDDLLAADLRALMGEEAFRHAGDAWMKLFRKRRKVPRAVVRPKA